MAFRSLRPPCLRGEYYYRYRNYIPEWGQFASPDLLLDATEPEGACNYVFCGNDPMGAIDPMGLDKIVIDDHIAYWISESIDQSWFSRHIWQRRIFMASVRIGKI